MLSEPGADICVFRSELWIGNALMATGHAEEVRNQGNVNRTSHVENCETSSLGRMCESYAPTADHTKRPSREEMQKVQRVSGATTITESGDLASDKQRNMIRAVCKSLGKTPPTNLDGMTKRQASAYIDELKRMEAEGQPEPDDANYAPEEPF
jgi:diphthamide synthase (EF-2-diphthine--ammonia ligase)